MKYTCRANYTETLFMYSICDVVFKADMKWKFTVLVQIKPTLWGQSILTKMAISKNLVLVRKC